MNNLKTIAFFIGLLISNVVFANNALVTEKTAQVTPSDLNNFTYDNLINSKRCPTSVEYDFFLFQHQSEIDDFKANYPKCTQVPFLTITGDDITNLDGFSNIVTVTEDVLIGDTNPKLTSLSGLNNVTKIGGSLAIAQNASLTDIDGFQNLKSVEILYVSENPNLTRIVAMPKLSDVRGGIFIANSPSLTSIDGTFSALKSLGGERTVSNGGGLSISAPNLTSLMAFSSLTSVYSISLLSNLQLTSLDGLQNITDLINYQGDKINDNRVILFYNKQLTDCSQLSQLYQKYPYSFAVDISTNPNRTPTSCIASVWQVQKD